MKVGGGPNYKFKLEGRGSPYTLSRPSQVCSGGVPPSRWETHRDESMEVAL